MSYPNNLDRHLEFWQHAIGTDVIFLPTGR